MKRLFLAASLLLAACAGPAAPPTPSPSPELTRYVIGGENNRKDFYYLVLSACSEKPTSWASFRAFCNREEISAVVVSAEEYARYSQGDPYPKLR